MFATTCAPASARSVAGGPGCQMSSQTVGPIERLADLQQEKLPAGLEVAILVEHAVVRQEPLVVDGLDLSVGADGAGVEEIAVEVRGPDETR